VTLGEKGERREKQREKAKDEEVSDEAEILVKGARTANWG
jgi:hypothetical protein